MDYWGLISQAKAWLISFGTPPSLGLILIMFAILRWAARYVAVIALLDFPGTLCHELAHIVTGFLTMAKPAGIRLWPERTDTGWNLGTASFRGIGILNAAPVALAPLLLYPLGAWLFEAFMRPAYQEANYWLWAGMGYVIASCWNSGLPSRQDLKLGGLSIILYALLAAAVAYTRLT